MYIVHTYIHMISYYRILWHKLPLRPTGCNNNGQLYDIWTALQIQLFTVTQKKENYDE